MFQVFKKNEMAERRLDHKMFLKGFKHLKLILHFLNKMR